MSFGARRFSWRLVGPGDRVPKLLPGRFGGETSGEAPRNGFLQESVGRESTVLVSHWRRLQECVCAPVSRKRKPQDTFCAHLQQSWFAHGPSLRTGVVGNWLPGKLPAILQKLSRELFRCHGMFIFLAAEAIAGFGGGNQLCRPAPLHKEQINTRQTNGHTDTDRASKRKREKGKREREKEKEKNTYKKESERTRKK